jgi:hypothetical protein
MATLNEKFASALNIIGQKGALSLGDMTAAASTCKDAQSFIGSVMHHFLEPCNAPSGPKPVWEIRPWQDCFKCKCLTAVVWPLPPFEWSIICESCIQTGYKSLGCLTTMEARRLYHIRDLSTLQWVPHPEKRLQTRYYLKSDVSRLAVACSDAWWASPL